MAVWNESRVFVDTNILFYTTDVEAGAKHHMAKKVVTEIWEARTGVISTQILSEWIVNLEKKVHLDWRSIDRLVAPYLFWEVVVIEPPDPLKALQIANKHKLSFWDSMVLCSAHKARAAALLTEDLNPGQTIGEVRILNPLVEG